VFSSSRSERAEVIGAPDQDDVDGAPRNQAAQKALT
jgi:hypothetical protein